MWGRMRGSECRPKLRRRDLWLQSGLFYFLFFVLCGLPGWPVGLDGVGIRFGEAQPAVGSWQVVVQNAGVSAAHMVLTRYNTVIIFDRMGSGASNLSLPTGACPAPTTDCSAHSVEYSIFGNSIRRLDLVTDAFSSSGAVTANGTLVQTGGANDGASKVRWFAPCGDKTCDWNEAPPDVAQLQVPRSFASDQILPDNRVIVVGGEGQFSYEFMPRAQTPELYSLPFLNQTLKSALVENNLYPFVHLTPDGNLFIFANQDSVLLNYTSNTIVRSFPRMPGYESRNYPASGSSVMLPLSYTDGFQGVEIMVCGGARQGATEAARAGTFMPASQNCGRLKLTDQYPLWVMEAMPTPRLMNDMILLPSGDVLLINGCQQGSADWGLGREPSLAPFLYRPNMPLYQRFETLASSTIPRLYQSSAALLPDGTVLVGGSNPNNAYAFSRVLYPTELRLETFSPPYLDPQYDNARPNVTFVSATQVSYGSTLRMAFVTIIPLSTFTDVDVVLYAPPFTTHSFSMNQRLLNLQATMQIGGDLGYQVDVVAPPYSSLAPPGFYMLFLLYQGIPSQGIWVQLVQGLAAQSSVLDPF